jgi:hypothetical protein
MQTEMTFNAPTQPSYHLTKISNLLIKNPRMIQIASRFLMKETTCNFHMQIVHASYQQIKGISILQIQFSFPKNLSSRAHLIELSTSFETGPDQKNESDF